MNRKILTLFAVFLVAISMASVCAVELSETHDFDGLFKMNIDVNDNFTNVSDLQDHSSLFQSAMAYKNANESVFVLVYGDTIESSIFFMSYGDIDYQTGDNLDAVKTEGNLTLLNITPRMESQKENYDITTLVGISSDDESSDPLTVFIGGNNETLLKEYANSIEFN